MMEDNVRQQNASHAPPRRGRVIANCGSGVPIRRSTRISSNTVGGAEARDQAPTPAAHVAANGVDDGAAAALWLLQQLASGYRSLCLYKCEDAILAFRALPQQQYNTGWVLNQARFREPHFFACLCSACAQTPGYWQVGRAHFEMVQYSDALRSFEQAQVIEPHRLSGIEVRE